MKTRARWAGLTPLGWIVDVYDFQEALSSGSVAQVALASVFFLPGGDAFRAVKVSADVLNKPLAKNAAYLIGNHKYATDNLGRVKNVSGPLEIAPAGRNPYQQVKSVVIKDGVKGADDGGHLIAQMFEGAKEQINYLPMLKESNRWGEWRQLEKVWEEALQKKKKVNIDITPNYKGDSKRPSSFDVTYEINGKATDTNIPNE